MPQINRATLTKRNVNVIAGIDKHVLSPMTISGKTYTPAELKSVFTQHTAALDAADALHKQWTDQLQVADAAGKKASITHALLRGALLSQYGTEANAVLNDFGMTVPKPRGPKTVKTKALAVDRRAGTRTARHTMGKVQKKDVTWASLPAPVTPTPTPAPPTSPAPRPAPAGPVASHPATPATPAAPATTPTVSN